MKANKEGVWGEIFAARHMRDNGYKILACNFSCRFGEIDIIAERREYIVFVEVKTRKAGSLVSGEEAVNFKKQERIILTAEDYISKTLCELQPRFDVAVVTVTKKPDGSDIYNLNYITNAF